MKKVFHEAKNLAADLAKNWIKTDDVLDEGFSNAKFSDNVVVLVHGYSHSVKPMAWHLRQPLEAAGFNVFVFDPGSNVNKKIEDTSQELAVFIEKVCHAAGVGRVSLVAHSMGGLVALYYLEKLGGHKRINKIITAGTPFHGTHMAYFGAHTAAARQMIPASKFLQTLLKDLHYADRIISVRTRQDRIVKPNSSSVLAGAKNVQTHSSGHIALVRSDGFLNIVRKELK